MDKFDPFKAIGLNASDIVASNLRNSLSESEAIMRKINQDAVERRKRQEERDEELLTATLQIRDNTSSLHEIVGLLRESNLNQEELKLILEDIAALIMARDKKEAETIVRRAIGKINGAAQSLESINILTQSLMLFYKTVVPLLG